MRSRTLLLALACDSKITPGFGLSTAAGGDECAATPTIGIPTPLVTIVTMTFNGTDLGAYGEFIEECNAHGKAAEPGLLMRMTATENSEDPNKFYSVSIFANDRAAQAHILQPGMADVFAKNMALGAGDMDVHSYGYMSPEVQAVTPPFPLHPAIVGFDRRVDFAYDNTFVNGNGEDSPVVARCCTTLEDGVTEEYLAAAKECDASMREAEPGLLLRSMYQDPQDQSAVCWIEVYRNGQAVMDHLSDPAIPVFMERHEALGGGPMIGELFGTLPPEMPEMLAQAGHTSYPAMWGYFRNTTFN